MATKPLVDALLAQDPYLNILITCMTPTGSTRIISLYGDRVKHVYLPYDYPFAIERFLNHVQPSRFIVMETEWWPNLFLALQKRKIPLYIVNARLSDKSYRGYARIKPLTALMLDAVTHVAAQSEDTKLRFIRLGMPEHKITITGSMKYDMDVNPDTVIRAQLLRETWGDRPIWVVASTHPAEEPLIIAAMARIYQALPNVLTIWAPRHLERFLAVKQLCEASGYTVARRSLEEVVMHDTQVYIADTLGELALLYGCADVAFVGGSLTPVGGHNLLEPAIMKTTILTGKHVHNFKEISRALLDNQAMVSVEDADDLAKQVLRLLCDPIARQHYVNNAMKVVDLNRGATSRVMNLLR
jgi:3-deoxy-D-manno-octulosonic-acid transferase